MRLQTYGITLLKCRHLLYGVATAFCELRNALPGTQLLAAPVEPGAKRAMARSVLYGPGLSSFSVTLNFLTFNSSICSVRILARLMIRHPIAAVPSATAPTARAPSANAPTACAPIASFPMAADLDSMIEEDLLFVFMLFKESSPIGFLQHYCRVPSIPTLSRNFSISPLIPSQPVTEPALHKRLEKGTAKVSRSGNLIIGRGLT